MWPPAVTWLLTREMTWVLKAASPSPISVAVARMVVRPHQAGARASYQSEMSTEVT